MTKNADITEEEIVSYLVENGLIGKSRKPELIDPRDFLVSILYFHFQWPEVRIGALLGRKASSINHCKKSAYALRNDPTFKENTKEVRALYPEWTPPEPNEAIEKRRKGKQGKKRPVIFYLTDQEYEKLETLRRTQGVHNVSTAVKNFLLDNL